jgi:hypothetical protein
MVSWFRSSARAWFYSSFGAVSEAVSDGFNGFALSGFDWFQVRESSVSVVSPS